MVKHSNLARHDVGVCQRTVHGHVEAESRIITMRGPSSREMATRVRLTSGNVQYGSRYMKPLQNSCSLTATINQFTS